ncbi:MAG: hypothetical protein ONB46_19615 [candidate division KSB1 bacterium]|nr:hypothetical protein [candidate division KSB1 bacterium]MDZ7368085.1 hypothetical protein [candidate division KSB1 bacterium]MDZ7405689.1 hypothetical protein [candidate division KSB1 bacterium]
MKKKKQRAAPKDTLESLVEQIKSHLPASAILGDPDEWDAEFGSSYTVRRLAGEGDHGVLCEVNVHGKTCKIPFLELNFDEFEYPELSKLQYRYMREWEKLHPPPDWLRKIFTGK